MSKEKQIEELTNELVFTSNYGTYNAVANYLVNKGYRKQSENTVEVVRCKDCDFFQMVNGQAMCSINAKKEGNLCLGLRATAEDGFCHNGSKMKGD